MLFAHDILSSDFFDFLVILSKFTVHMGAHPGAADSNADTAQLQHQEPGSKVVQTIEQQMVRMQKED